jgi:hypothetical protein
MSSLRKKYRPESFDKDAPVATTPVVAELPAPAELKAEPTEKPENKSPVEEAAKSALRDRLREMENAEGIAREALSQQQRMATEEQLITEPIAIEPEQEQQPLTVEQIIEGSGLPERAKRWLRQHTDYVLDPEKNAHIQGLHYAAAHQAGGDAYSDLYFEKMESLLGLRQAPNGNGTRQPTQPRAVQRQAALVRQQGAVPVRAPPHRDVPSFSTNRPPSHRAPLTEAQREIARASGITDQEYSRQLEIMERMKAAGQLQDH